MFENFCRKTFFVPENGSEFSKFESLTMAQQYLSAVLQTNYFNMEWKAMEEKREGESEMEFNGSASNLRQNN